METKQKRQRQGTVSRGYMPPLDDDTMSPLQENSQTWQLTESKGQQLAFFAR
jgi:hypothetical protein